MKPRTATVLTVMAVVVGTVGAPAAAQGQTPGLPADILDGIDEIATLPARAFHVVEAQGRTVVVSTNGHYAMINGGLWDLWNGFEIASVADVERSLSIPLQRMGLGDHTLAGITLSAAAPGTEAPGGRVTLFVDPLAAETGDALAAVRALVARYSFRLVFVPANTSRYGATRNLLCSEAAAQAYVRTGQVPRTGPSQPDCGLEAMQRNLATVQVLGIDTLPFTIAPNGRVLPGVPGGYRDFLAANEE